ncbi:extracellular solute-binding protein [Phyllobacterium sp. YR531]|uniref:extracellular solute-binding protein n=1 Tax=Phyllobacterium sp. YR531 TaxID=1144343 RepID=UPI00026FAA02|nr:extracellular solute-binding protein [Phyllobacterium sp. YR531]EJN02254.1 ABC-type sugar transport system, periplasmic component [Phyllobacterium sp. YR531]
MTGLFLKGMTWHHPRGYDPMVACSKIWQEQTGVSIEWDKRSLQDFESFPVEALAKAYDLIVIDHPHVGQITKENCLLPLDRSDKSIEFDAISKGSVGQSFISYNWQKRQWAFPIDAAAQVQAWRPDLLANPPKKWREVIELARKGQVLLPLLPPHSLMTFFTLTGNLGQPCANDDSPVLIDPNAGNAAFDLMREIVDLVDPPCFEMDPIAVLERLAKTSAECCSPFIYGYANYAVKGFRENIVAFGDIPSTNGVNVKGSALGGTGIAVSAFSKHPAEATDFAYWIAGGELQSSLYATSGGQPGHATAWEDTHVNAATTDFYRATRATLQGAWLRPRHDGYMGFQKAASYRINDALKAKEKSEPLIADLNRLYRESFVG